MKRDFWIVMGVAASASFAATMAATATSVVEDSHQKCLKASDYMGCLTAHQQQQQPAKTVAAKPAVPQTVQKTGFGFLASWMDPKEVGQNYGGYRVTRVFAGSPAAVAGLNANDKLVKIGKIDTDKLTVRQISALLKDDMSDGAVGPLTFRSIKTGACETISLKKGDYTITKAEQKALKSKDKKALVQTVLDPSLVEAHNKARQQIKAQMASVNKPAQS